MSDIGAIGGIAGPARSGVLGGAPVVGKPLAGAGGESFGGSLGKAVSSVESAQAKADGLAELAATGQLDDVHEFTIAAAQAQLATSLTVAVRNKAVEAFNEVMRMQV